MCHSVASSQVALTLEKMTKRKPPMPLRIAWLIVYNSIAVFKRI
jgi:hypothetical protein